MDNTITMVERWSMDHPPLLLNFKMLKYVTRVAYSQAFCSLPFTLFCIVALKLSYDGMV
jgi:hypothetical protein